MKRTVHKKAHHVSRKRTAQKKLPPFVAFRVVAIGFAVLLLILGIRSLQASVHVLGVTTGPAPLLADKGSDDSGGSSGGSGGGESSGGGSGSSGGGSTSGGGETRGGGDSGKSGGFAQVPVSQDTQVDCVGPNGVHFTASFHDCQEFNQKWSNPGFRFVPLTTPQEKPEIEQETEASGPAHETLHVETEGNKGQLNLATPGLQVEIKREDDGSVHLTAKRADGTEVALQTNALEQLNEALKDKEIEVASSSSTINALVLRRKGVEAETELPISVDPSTHELTITTPAGVRTVTVLPDQAVNNLLANKILTSVQTAVSSTSGAITQQTTLTSLNNQPVFQVSGVNQKRLLGLVPLAFAKTAFVSAANGSVVQVNEALFNRILEALSF